MRKRTITLFSSLLLLIASACASAAPPPTPTPTDSPQVTLTISGSGGVSGLLSNAQAAFEADTPDYTLNVLSGSGTGGGVQGVLDGLLDIAAMARGPKDDETAKGLQYLNIGSTGVAILVHPDVEVTDLTQDQVRDIFSGAVTNWSEVGGQDLAIVIYVRDEEESSTLKLRELIFGETPFPETIAGVLGGAGDMLTSVEGTPGSIGFGNWIATVGSDKKVKTVTLDGVAPNDDTYSIATPLGIGYVEDRQEAVQPLLDWVASERGQAALRDLGVINLPSE